MLGYRIEVRRDETSPWSHEGLAACESGEVPFASIEDAQSAVAGLRRLGDDWADAEYRIVMVEAEDVK